MPSSPNHMLQYLRDDVWTFTRVCENLISDAKHLSSAERAILSTYLTDLQAQLRSLDMAETARAGNSR